MKKAEKRIAPLVALTGMMCGCCCDKVATAEPHIVAKIADCARYEALNPQAGGQGEGGMIRCESGTGR